MDAKSITLELDDNRVLDFKRTDKTKFFKGGDELKSPEFSPGDQLSVEGPRDQAGYLTAVNVYWEKAADKAAVADRDKNVHDTWKDDAAKPDSKDAAAKDAEEADAAQRPTEPAPPPAKPDASDPGPPTLRRGKPADVARERAAPVPEVAAAQPSARRSVSGSASARGCPEAPAAAPAPAPAPAEAAKIPVTDQPPSDEDIISSLQRPMEPLIRKATEAALEFTETLPDYVCQEMMARFQSESHPANWQPLDVVSTNVIYRSGKEEYRDLAVNGKPVKKSMEELGGAWSTGEFGTVLIDLFSPATAAQFRGMGDSRMAGVTPKNTISKSSARTPTGPSTWLPRPTTPPTKAPCGSTRPPRAYCASRWRRSISRMNFPPITSNRPPIISTSGLGDARQYLLAGARRRR